MPTYIWNAALNGAAKTQTPDRDMQTHLPPWHGESLVAHDAYLIYVPFHKEHVPVALFPHQCFALYISFVPFSLPNEYTVPAFVVNDLLWSLFLSTL